MYCVKANSCSDIPSHSLASNYCLYLQSQAIWMGAGARREKGGGHHEGHWVPSLQTLPWQLIPGCSSVWWQRDFRVFPKVFYSLFYSGAVNNFLSVTSKQWKISDQFSGLFTLLCLCASPSPDVSPSPSPLSYSFSCSFVLLLLFHFLILEGKINCTCQSQVPTLSAHMVMRRVCRSRSRAS